MARGLLLVSKYMVGSQEKFSRTERNPLVNPLTHKARKATGQPSDFFPEEIGPLSEPAKPLRGERIALLAI